MYENKDIYIYIYIFENGCFRENNKYNHGKDCSVLHVEQQLCHAVKNRHFSTYV